MRLIDIDRPVAPFLTFRIPADLVDAGQSAWPWNLAVIGSSPGSDDRKPDASGTYYVAAHPSRGDAPVSGFLLLRCQTPWAEDGSGQKGRYAEVAVTAYPDGSIAFTPEFSETPTPHQG
jgi:hypothetical protein